MQNYSTPLAVIALLVGVVAMGFALSKPASTTVVTQPPFGATASNSFPQNCLTVNGVTTCHARIPMIPATTTPCAINIGSTGTSTLIRATIIQDVASTSIVTIARANTQYATTTFLEEDSVTANTQPVIVYNASSTPGTPATATKNTFGPGVGSSWLVFGVAAGATTLNGPTGVCEATWQVLKNQNN